MMKLATINKKIKQNSKAYTKACRAADRAEKNLRKAEDIMENANSRVMDLDQHLEALEEMKRQAKLGHATKGATIGALK